MTEPAADLVRAVDELEGRAAGYVTLEQVERTVGHPVGDAIAEGLLLVDYRERVDVTTGARTSVTLCRLNRRHPMVQNVTAW